MKHANYSFFIPHLGCPHRCSFCDQHTIAETEWPPTPDAVAQELAIAQEIRSDTEIAFFGGSFTALPREMMQSYLEAAAPFVKSGGFAGIRISTRPDAISDNVVALLSRYPVTAVELGAQSMDDTVLSLNRRGHTAADVIEASKKVHAAGWSLGLQMMTGLYGDTAAGSIETAKRLIACRPDTVRIYPTVVLPGTLLAEWYQTGMYHPPGVAETVPLCAELLSLFEAADIRVIRLGLHASPRMEQEMLAGCYHPALRELCIGHQLCMAVKEQLSGMQEGDYIVYTAPADQSAMIGQHKEQIRRFAAYGYRLRVVPDKSLDRGQILIEREGE